MDLNSLLQRIAGAYNPIFNSVVVNPLATDDEGFDYTGSQHVPSHEKEHKRQFNYPGDYSSDAAINSFSSVPSFNELQNRGYSRRSVPMEAMAHMEGANSSEIDSRNQAQMPHPGWTELPDAVKLRILSNKDSWQTDQNFLDNIHRYGLTGANFVERWKHLYRDSKGRLADLFK